jgi:hypothetical protein
MEIAFRKQERRSPARRATKPDRPDISSGIIKRVILVWIGQIAACISAAKFVFTAKTLSFSASAN